MEYKFYLQSEKYLKDCAILEEKCFSEPWTLSSFKESLKLPFYNLLVICHGELFCGYIGFYLIADEAQILNVAVVETMRNRSVGKMLVNKACETAKEKGATKITLEVRISNISAQKLYEKCGFLKDGERKSFYKNPTEDALLFSKIL